MSNVNLHGKDLKEYAQQVWMLTELEDKRAVMLDMIENFDFKTKSARLTHQVQNISICTKLDELAANLTLLGVGLRTI